MVVYHRCFSTGANILFCSRLISPSMSTVLGPGPLRRTSPSTRQASFLSRSAPTLPLQPQAPLLLSNTRCVTLNLHQHGLACQLWSHCAFGFSPFVIHPFSQVPRSCVCVQGLRPLKSSRRGTAPAAATAWYLPQLQCQIFTSGAGSVAWVTWIV